MGLKILFVVVAIMAVVLILLSIFSSGAQDISGVFDQWVGQTGETPKACHQLAEEDCTLLRGCHWCDGDCKPVSEECKTGGEE